MYFNRLIMSIKVTIKLVFFTIHLYIGLTRSLLECNAPILKYKIAFFVILQRFRKKASSQFSDIRKDALTFIHSIK